MSYQDFKKINTVILGISVDSVFAHKVWNEKELSKMVVGGLPFPLLSDQNGRLGRLYGVYDQENGVHLRGTFIIDSEDRVQSSEILGTAVGRNSDQLLRKVKAFQHHAKTGELIPADWQKKLDKSGKNGFQKEKVNCSRCKYDLKSKKRPQTLGTFF